MVMVRITAFLVLVAAVLAVLYFVTRNPGYLKWAWRVFVAALVCIVGVMAFYFVERLQL